MKTHNVTNKSVQYPNAHKVLFPTAREAKHTINVQSNVEINQYDNVVIDGQTYNINRIIKKTPCNPDVFEYQAKDGFYVEGLTTFYVLEGRLLVNKIVQI